MRDLSDFATRIVKEPKVIDGISCDQLVIVIEPVGIRITLENHKTSNLLWINRLVVPEEDVLIGYSHDLDLPCRMRHDQPGTLGKTRTSLQSLLEDVVCLLDRYSKSFVA